MPGGPALSELTCVEGVPDDSGTYLAWHTGVTAVRRPRDVPEGDSGQAVGTKNVGQWWSVDMGACGLAGRSLNAEAPCLWVVSYPSTYIHPYLAQTNL